MCASSSSVKSDELDSNPIELIIHEPLENKKTCCGRKVSLCNCISQNTLYTIATLIGVVLLAIGSLALAGYFAPATGGSFVALLQKINAVANFVALKLGSDLFTLALFTTAFGTAFTLTGVVGLCVNKCRQNEAQKLNLDKLDLLET